MVTLSASNNVLQEHRPCVRVFWCHWGVQRESCAIEINWTGSVECAKPLYIADLQIFGWVFPTEAPQKYLVNSKMTDERKSRTSTAAWKNRGTLRNSSLCANVCINNRVWYPNRSCPCQRSSFSKRWCPNSTISLILGDDGTTMHVQAKGLFVQT